MEQGTKADDGKPRMDLIPAYPLEMLAKVYTMGAVKYAAHNWRKGIAYSRIFAAIMRHLWAWQNGEDNDPESGLPHPVHAAFGCFALIQYMKDRTQFDDRYSTTERRDKAIKAAEDVINAHRPFPFTKG